MKFLSKQIDASLKLFSLMDLKNFNAVSIDIHSYIREFIHAHR